MRNQVRSYVAVGELYQVKSWCTRGKGEVSDADKVSVRDAVLMSLQSIERPPNQIGGYPAVDSFRSSESEGGAC